MKEKIHDEQISPLMERILAICKEHKIAMVADFSMTIYTARRRCWPTSTALLALNSKRSKY